MTIDLDLARFVRVCAGAGFDLVHAFEVDGYNRTEPAAGRLETFGRTSSLGLLVGNGRALWDQFLAAVRGDEGLSKDSDPLDRYTERTLELACRTLSCRCALRYVHAVAGGPLPVQRIADRIGFAELGPAHLSVHWERGPWFAFRALVLLDAPGPGGETPPLARPCEGCGAPCVAALARVPSGDLSSSVKADWRRWVEIRDACPVGREHRYTEGQIEYHYARRRDRLASRGQSSE